MLTAENKTYRRHFNDERDWFFTRRFGLFIHWGLYAINAWHEQELWRRRLTREQYVPLAGKFNPKKFNPEEWLDIAEDAGMKYLVFTTKHHDGFALYDTAYSDFKVTNSPYRHDILAQLAEACHKRNFPLGLYYSVVDWMHPNYPNLGRHHELPPQSSDTPDDKLYLEFLKNQVRELCTNYGKIHAFWWDMNVAKWHDTSINNLIRELQPACVINNRGMDEGDFGTPERDWNTHAAGEGTPFEACQSVGIESWGHRTNENYYSDRYLMRSVDKYLTAGGNYLLNVGPDKEGVIPEQSAGIIKRLGKWYKAVEESFDGAKPFTDMPAVSGINGSSITCCGNNLYIHLAEDFSGHEIYLKPITQLPLRAVLLNNGQELLCRNDMTPSLHVEQKGYLRVCGVPVNDLANTCAVIKLEFAQLPDATNGCEGRNDNINIQ